MSVLIAHGLKRHFGAHEVLRGTDLRLEPGEKVGVVGRNGGGKTTLMKVIAGLEQPDDGELILPKGVRLSYVPQRPEFEPGTIAFEHVSSGLDEVRQVREALEKTEQQLGELDGDALDAAVTRYGELNDRMEFLAGWTADQRVEQVLSGIGFPEQLWERDANTLSGGEKARVAMAAELVRRPDLLLIDEPTNHLDLDGIEWLEAYLKELPSAVLLISHDRRMLDNVVDAIVELEFGELVRYPGNFSKYLVLRAERVEAAIRAYDNQAEKLRKEEQFIKKHMGSQRTSEAKGRLKRLKRVERLERPINDVRRPILKMGEVQRSGEKLFHGEELAIGHGDKALHEGLEVRLGRGERVGLVGPNGAGKTTLLKVLAGKTAPIAGKLERGHKAVCGYYDQEQSDLDPESTPFKTIKREHPTATDEEIRSHLALFLFRGDDVDLPVGGLSGGERARLTLARLVLENPTWLALDEPTNHLDLASRTALEEMLSGYPGAMLCISHDREFLDNLCTRILELGPDGLREFKGNYTDYRNALNSEASAAAEAKAAKEKAAKEAAKKQAEKQKQAAKQQGKGGKSKGKSSGSDKGGGKSGGGKVRNPYLFKKLEEEIMKLETEKEELNTAMTTEEVYRDADKMRDCQMRLAEVERDLEDRNQAWEEWVS